jgi:hypothetical protein
MLRRLTILALLGVVALVAVVLAAAGSGGSANLVSGSAVAQAAEATAKLPGSSLAMHITMDLDGLPHPIEAQMTGVSNNRKGTARMSGYYLHMPSGVPGADADGKVPFESVAVLPRIYMKSPLLASQIQDGKQWLSYDVAKTGQALGIGDPTRFNQSGDPTQTLRNLRATSDRVERLGTEDVRGVATTHYRGTVELRRLPDLLPAEKRDAARKSVDRMIELAGTDSYPMEIWIDRKHLVRRFKLTMNMKMAQVGDKRMKMEITTDMFDFGPKPVAKAPPEDEVYDVTAQASQTP